MNEQTKIIDFQEAVDPVKPHIDKAELNNQLTDEFEDPPYPFARKGKIISMGSPNRLKLPVVADSHIQVDISPMQTKPAVMDAEVQYINDSEDPEENGYYLVTKGNKPGTTVVKLIVQGEKDRQKHELGVDEAVEIPYKVEETIRVLENTRRKNV